MSRNALLLAALSAAILCANPSSGWSQDGPGPAREQTRVQWESMSEQDRQALGERRQNTTPEQREAMRDRFRAMSPEQRDAARERFRSMTPEQQQKGNGGQRRNRR